jgi:copper transport protein
MGALIYLWLTLKHTKRGNEPFKQFILRTVAIASALAVLTGLVMLAVQTNVASILQSSLTWSYLLYVKVASVGVMLAIAYRQTKRWRKSNSLLPKLLRWEILFGIVAILAGVWMSQTNYPTAAPATTVTTETTITNQHH